MCGCRAKANGRLILSSLMAEGAQHARRKKVEMIESGVIFAGVGVLVLVVMARLLARRPAHVPVPVRIRDKER
jgi:hypothetical protein